MYNIVDKYNCVIYDYSDKILSETMNELILPCCILN